MANNEAKAWYKAGSVKVTQNNTAVTGTNTNWINAGISTGDLFTIDGEVIYEIASVNSATSITLASAYVGATLTGTTYKIIQRFMNVLNSELAARVSYLVNKYETYIDTDMKTISGKSAYEVAVANGYSGTVTQWLESLKAAQEWSTLNTRTQLLTYNNAGAHNAYYRGKNLGTFTSAQSAAIRAGTFEDLYPGDYWTFSNVAYSYEDANGETQTASFSGTFRLADCDYALRCGDSDLTTHHIVVVPDAPLFNAQMNPTNTTEGGYIGSVMRTTHLKRAEAIVKACFGEGHVLKRRNLFTNAVTDGKPSGHAWYDSVVDLMNELMVYGSYVFAPANDGVTIPYRYTPDKSQLAMFKHRHDLIIVRNQWWWLRDVVSAAYFASVGNSGTCGCNYASNSNGVRPAALIY